MNDARPLVPVVLLVAAIAGSQAGHAPIEQPAAVSAELLAPAQERPVVNLPQEWRQKNWAPYGSGSCVHASMVMVMRWQGLYELAEWWRKTYHSGEYASRLHKRLDDAGVRFAGVENGDVAFLEWCIRTRRGAAITWKTAHMCLLVHLDEEWAGIIDNNRPAEVEWERRDSFVRKWRGYSGWATTVVYDPPPRPPWVRPDDLR